MYFTEKFFLTLRLRVLLALIAAAGAGVFLTYSAAKRIVEPLASEDSGTRILSSVKASAAAIDSEIASGLDRARLLAARPAVKELLYRRNRGEISGPARETLRLRLKDAAMATPGLTSLTISDARGGVAGSFEKPGGEKTSGETGGITANPDEVYVSPPLIEKGALFYEVAVPVQAAGGPGQAAAGTLRCRFTSAEVLRASRYPPADQPDLSLARRRGMVLITTSREKPRAEAAIGSDEAALFRPALLGKEGYAVAGGRSGNVLYAYSRLPAADWLIAAQARRPAAQPHYTAAILDKIRLQSWLCFALLVIGAFLAAKKLAAPMDNNVRLAAELLKECGIADAETSGPYPEAKLVARALTEAGSLMKQRAECGRQLLTEAEQLREEESELKYQNLELEKLNKYLLERETKISELKTELRELRGKITTGMTK